MYLGVTIALLLSAFAALYFPSDGQTTPSSSPDCFSGPSVWYRGSLNQTASGIPCQRWDTNKPHNVTHLPRDGIHHNYCRNPRNSMTRLWCYTSNTSVIREFCDLPKCPETANDSLLFYASGRPSTACLIYQHADLEIGLHQQKSHHTVYTVNTNKNIRAIASDIREKRIFFIDDLYNRLVVLHLDTKKASFHFQGMVEKIEALAYDWINRNLFFTESRKDLVAATDANFTRFSKVYQHDHEKPFAITINVLARRLYFSTESSFLPTIKSCNLDGSNVTEIAEFPDGSHIRSMVIDYADQSLYWIKNQGYFSFVMRSDFDGKNTSIVYEQLSGTFLSIAIYDDTIYIADGHHYRSHPDGKHKHYKIWLISKQHNRTVYFFKYPDKIHALSIYNTNDTSRNVRELISVCYPSNPCEHICLESYDQKRSCACSLGYNKVGEHRCEPNLLDDNFIITSDTVLKQLFQIPLEGFSEKRELGLLPLKHTENVGSFAVDESSKVIYWSDRSTSTLYRSNINGTNQRPLVHGSHARSIAVDYQTGNVYFADEDFNFIIVVNNDGSHRKTLLTPADVPDNYTRIQSIALDLVNKHVYWVACFECTETSDAYEYDYENTAPKGALYRMSMDGSNVQGIFFFGFTTPKVITISHARNSLFVVQDIIVIYEVPMDEIKHLTDVLPANVLTTVVDDASFSNHVHSIQVNDRYMYVTTSESKGIKTYDLDTGKEVPGISALDFSFDQIAIYNETRLNNTASSVSDCVAMKCQHLCLQNQGLNFTCACDDHYSLSTSDNSCLHESSSQTDATQQLPSRVKSTSSPATTKPESKGGQITNTPAPRTAGTHGRPIKNNLPTETTSTQPSPTQAISTGRTRTNETFATRNTNQTFSLSSLSTQSPVLSATLGGQFTKASKENKSATSEGGLSGGAIAAIVIVLLLTFVLVISAFICSKKRKSLCMSSSLKNRFYVIWNRSSDVVLTKPAETEYDALG